MDDIIEAAIDWFSASLHQAGNGWQVRWQGDQQSLVADSRERARVEGGLFLYLLYRSVPRDLAHKLACAYSE